MSYRGLMSGGTDVDLVSGAGVSQHQIIVGQEKHSFGVFRFVF